MKIKNMPDLRNTLSEVHSLRDHHEALKANFKDGYFACICGSRKFHLIQDKCNVKSKCSKCGSLEIIYWNGTGDSVFGSMLRLDSLEWIKPKATLQYHK